jgi:hypothetical protein
MIALGLNGTGQHGDRAAAVVPYPHLKRARSERPAVRRASQPHQGGCRPYRRRERAWLVPGWRRSSSQSPWQPEHPCNPVNHRLSETTSTTGSSSASLGVRSHSQSQPGTPRHDRHLGRRDAFHDHHCADSSQLATTTGGVTHVDGSARPQSVTADTYPLCANLLDEIAKLTGNRAVLNTSLNGTNKPRVETPARYFRCLP